jgi:hypothetical protein
MTHRPFWSLCGALAIAGATPLVCPAQSTPSEPSAIDSSDHHATAAANEAMVGSMANNPHFRLTPVHTANPADSARAAALVATIRRTLAKYRDVRQAESDGYRKFLPDVPQPVYHFTNYAYALQERFRFDPTKPTSLLYRSQPDRSLELIGVMYDDGPRTSLEELDRRVPLSIARWHQHVNWCVPPRAQKERWTETREGQPVFGPQSPIADSAACEAVGGRFLPRIFGWMVHVNAFASDDPKVIWGGEGHEQMH